MVNTPSAVVQLTIPFEALAQSVTNLSVDEKVRLLQQLEQELDDGWGEDPVARAEIDEAYADYKRGDYVTLEEFVARLDSADE